MPRVLVYQANGAQGAAVVRHVREAGYATRVLIRNESKSGTFTGQGIEVAVADLLDRDAMARAHESVDHVVLQIPAHADAFVAKAVENAVLAMTLHGVKGTIVKMAHATPAASVPDSGFSANAILLKRLQSCPVPFSVVEPTMYLDTFLKPNFRHEIPVKHVLDLPLPETQKVAWTTIDDSARLAVGLLEAVAYGSTVRCAGATALDGHALAEVFSEALGQGITYRSTPVDVFQREIEAAVGPAAAATVVSKFRFLSRFPAEAERLLAGTFRRIDALPDFEPTPIAEWVRSNRESFRTNAR